MNTPSVATALKTITDDEVISKILALTYTDGTPFIDMNDKKSHILALDIYGQYKTNGDSVFSSFAYANKEDYFMNQPVMSQGIANFNKEISLITYTPAILENTGMKCHKCKQETVLNTESRQIGRGDEATTFFFRCTTCGASWKKGR